MATKRPATLDPVHPNVGIEMQYRRKLEKLISEMHNSLVYWLTAAYRANTPEMAQDETPAISLREVFGALAKRWQRRFDDAAPELAEYFSVKAAKRADGALANILKRAGFSVAFKMTPEATDIMQATIGEQVGLIKSIASQHLSEIEGLVMRSVSTGRDLKYLTDELQKRFSVTRKRAAFIARDQNNKATASITRARQKGLGITEAVWMHSHAGKHPRPSHVAANGKRYDIDKGMYLDGVWTWPGVEINCRCLSRSVVPGF